MSTNECTAVHSICFTHIQRSVRFAVEGAVRPPCGTACSRIGRTLYLWVVKEGYQPVSTDLRTQKLRVLGCVLTPHAHWDVFRAPVYFQ